MSEKINVLFIGESWFFETTEYKGFDKFTSAGYQTAVEWIQKAIECDEILFTHMPCHEVTARFPETLEELQKYATDCSPHWASKELCEWEYYPVLWKNIVKWLANVN